jgi:CBS domain-containing protein
MPSSFDFSISPFDVLTAGQQSRVRAAVDVAYCPPGRVILEAGAAPTHLWVNIKGHVGQYEGTELVLTHGPHDVWDGRALVAGRSSHRFVAADEVIAHLVPGAVVQSLIAENAHFGALLFAELGDKLGVVASRASVHEMQSLTLSPVKDAFVRPVSRIDADADVLQAVRRLRADDARALLVSDARCTPPQLGMFTHTAVQHAVLDGRPLTDMAVREFARFPLITVRPEDTMGDALALLTRHRIHRLVVAEGTHVLGVLEALDVFSFLADHSHQIGLQIETAGSIDVLARAAAQITRMIERLYRGGTRVSLIASLVHDLQARLFERAWGLVAPPDLIANSCLFVMGSEGRGEQLLKTDQDNGLLLRDGYRPPADVQAICERFSDALAAFGYPPCPGGIMVRNPRWRGSAAEFGERVRHWLQLSDGHALMNLAILLDAQAVAGDADLLAQVLGLAHQGRQKSEVFMGRFAAAVDTFGHQHGWWARLLHFGQGQGERLDLKKEGLFALVHGTRALALQAGLTDSGTFARLQALQAQGVITASQATDWAQCLQFLMGLKLGAGLDELASGQPVSGAIDMARLSTLDRDLLRDALAVVRQYRQFLQLHFRLDLLA